MFVLPALDLVKLRELSKLLRTITKVMVLFFTRSNEPKPCTMLFYLHEYNKYDNNNAPAISRIPIIPPPTIYISNIPIANQNNVYPQILRIFPPKKHILLLIYAFVL